jgi:hypothetical protein
LERKVFLTADYIAEAFYCWLIEKATHLTYGHEPDKAYAWIDDIGESSLANISSARVVKQAGPRAFTQSYRATRNFPRLQRSSLSVKYVL